VTAKARQPRLRDVLFEQVRVTWLSLRIPSLVGVGLAGLATIVALPTMTRGGPLSINGWPTWLPGIMGALLPIAVAFVVLVLARPVAVGMRPLQLAYDRSPVLRHGVVAFGVLMLLAAGLNDSGLAIPAVGAMVAIPLLIAASVRALELEDAERLEAAIAAVRKASQPHKPKPGRR